MTDFPIDVAVEAPQHTDIHTPLTYLGNASLVSGTLVRVPLGRREVLGLVWSTGKAAAPEVELRSVIQALTALPPLNDAWRRLLDFTAAYYQRGLGEVALGVLPPELRKLDNAQLTNRIAKLRKALGKAPLQAVPPSTVTLPALTAEQGRLLAKLADPCAAGADKPVLVHGVTGSGKTEIYLRMAADVLAAGRQALVLVPEINLTPQLEARFAERFAGRTIVSLHSGLTPAQRLRNWLTAHLGLADLVLGTRLAVFASMR